MSSISAVYTSPEDSPHIISHPIVASQPAPGDVPAKIAYLTELRQRTSSLQDDVNAFLTAQMEADKKAAEAQGRSLSEKEAKEEANYGEEVVEEDA